MENLNNYNFTSHSGFNSTLINLRYDKLKKYYNGKTCLELGSADGEGTKHLINFFDQVVAVDGSEKLISEAKKYVDSNKVEFICSYFEDFKYNYLFDTVILAHILEHVDNPVEVLKIGASFLNEGGILIADVPNAKSLHRELGVKLGMIETIYQLNEADLSIGHKRVYDLDSFKEDIKKAGLEIIKEGGIFIKIFSNKQLEDLNMNLNLIQALSELGDDFPNVSAEIYCICKKA